MKHNDREIMDFINKGADEYEYESLHKISQNVLVKNTAQTIQFESIYSIDVDIRHSHGYVTG